RAGVITASMFEEARKKLKSGPNKGQPTAAANDYAFRLAVERISGEPLSEGFETYAMRRGRELEPMARFEHEAATGLIVEEAGLVLSDNGLFGASADGLIDDNGGAEYKCFIDASKLRSIWIDNDIGDVIAQVQGGMWITGREYWHMALYCPALEPIGKQLWWREFKRDDEYIEQLERDMNEFAKLVDHYENILRNKAA
ncbi:lambda exonuclease family protein, partial [Carnimonas bestiolae]|uniref:lambda exonuclease family protein n=1 Tax=Carnimonas bestiolae TaxID=3402172 RepID=UPI003F4ACEEE